MFMFDLIIIFVHIKTFT